jgi:hypothetical protein
VTKRACEDLAQVYRGGLPITGLRYLTVFGPRQRPDMALRRICDALVRRRPFTVYGDGFQSRDFTYVSDACDATYRAALVASPAPVYNVGGGEEATLARVIGVLERLLGVSLELRRVAAQRGDVRRTAADVMLARGSLGWTPAVALLHRLPARELPRFARLDLERLRGAAEVIGRARPELGGGAARLAAALAAARPAAGEAVHLHGDVHPRNVLVDGGRLALIDLDQAGAGQPAADLGSVLARLRQDRFVAAALPVDLAVIPAALAAEPARRLRRRVAASGGLVALHQHGYSHANHERAGRKHEFGPARSAERQRDDIARGRRLLDERLGPAVAPIFTPPWNRCTPVTARCVAELGFRVLSRDATAAPLGRVDPQLIELPVNVDWFARRKGVRLDRWQLGALLGGAAAGPDPVGVMLHHTITDDRGMAAVGELLALVAGHPAARASPMLEAAGLAVLRGGGPSGR